MHQIVEYLLGGALLAQGLQSPEPVAPALAGLLVLANAATVRGAAFSAFRLVSRRVHRVLDLVVIAAVVVLAVQPWIDADDGLRLVMLGIAAGLGFVWWRSSFAERARPSVATGAVDDRGVRMGRAAGRFVGDGINAVKRTAARRGERPDRT
jgi:hypothetical protein